MKSTIFRRILKGILIILILLIVVVAGLFGYLTVTEFNPEAGSVESLEVHAGSADGIRAGNADGIQTDAVDENRSGTAEEIQADTAGEIQADTEGGIQADTAGENQADTSGKIQTDTAGEIQTGIRKDTQTDPADGNALRIVTWNLGFGALGDNTDFFMDGGKNVITADKARVQSNMQMITEELKKLSPDIILTQEVDRNSSRSYAIDETALLQETFPEMDTSFANNYKVAFVPYPIPPMGRMDSGILTMSSLPITRAERIQLPCPFTWPVRIANLKRCLMIDRIPLEDGRELVLINLHLEAYDNGEGKVKQTQMLAQIMQEEAAKGNPVIAGGDWNQIFSSADHGQFPAQEGKWKCGQIEEEQFPGDWQFVMDADSPSCRSLDQPYAGADKETFQYYLLDGFVLSPDIKVISCETQELDFVCSDHNPVLLEVELN